MLNASSRKSIAELQEAKRRKAEQYQQIFGDLSLEHRIIVCFECECRGAGYVMGHSRAHAHVDERKICLATQPKGYSSFFTALHEMGHIVAKNASYSSGVPRALAEHNATEWAYEELRKRGIPIKRRVKREYDAYISNKIARGVRRGLKVVPPELRRKFRRAS